MTAHAVAAIVKHRPAIWGGDWNHSLRDREYVGSLAGRNAILAGLAEAGLRAATADLASRNDGQWSIDHVAVAQSAVSVARHIPAERRLSDHDAYVVDIEGPGRA